MLRRLIFTTLCLAAMAVGATAQNRVTYGARLAMEVSVPGGSNSIYKVGSGFTAGAVANIALPKKFFVEPGLLFYFSAMSAKDLISFDDKYFYEGAARLYGLRVPVNFGYNFYVADNWDMAVSTGPYVNFNLSAQQTLSPNLGAPVPVPDRKISLFDHGWKRVDGGWNINLSVTFAESYYVGVSGGVSFTPLASYGNKDKKIKIYRNTVAISLGYNF